MRIVILGLSITSSWGNGHATTWRALLRALHRRGHAVLFLERDQPWYASQRDLPAPPFCRTELYSSNEDLRRRHAHDLAEADAVIIGSYVPDGIEVCAWALEQAQGQTAFYDIDTPVTLAALAAGNCAYLDARQIPRFDLYLSFSGGAALEILRQEYHARRAGALYCSVDPAEYFHTGSEPRWDLGYLGTYSADRQPSLQELLLEPAIALPPRAFAVAGPSYPADVFWPPNVARFEHLPPAEHRAFYNAQAFTLNVTRADMRRLGHSPSVRLFEAAACGTPIISDSWPGLEELLSPGEEILLAEKTSDVLEILQNLSAEDRRSIGSKAAQRILHQHTADHRASELEQYLGWKTGSANAPSL